MPAIKETERLTWDSCTEVKAKAWYGKIEEPFCVPTPSPYIIEGKELTDPHKAKLLKKAAILWKVLDMLGIDAEEAFRRNYTLNLITNMELERVAIDKQQYDVLEIIRKQLK